MLKQECLSPKAVKTSDDQYQYMYMVNFLVVGNLVLGPVTSRGEPSVIIWP